VRENSIAVSTAARLADLPPERQREVARDKDSARAAAKALREETANERRETRCAAIAAMAAPQPQLDLQQRYPVVYADPPWRYEHIETESRAIENQYPTMSLDEIKALPVTAIATDDAVLFLWATSPKLAEALEVMSAWGWTYRTCMVWDKEIIGMGYYARQQHELLLIGTRGSPPPPEPSSRPPSVFRERRGEHSAKPDHYYDLIESMYPDWPRVELFARRPRTGWQQWGNQVGS
jgi:N6-adenosine-specific RNA methylase IME4